MKFIRIFLLVLIIIGIGLLFTQNLWVPRLVDAILKFENVTLDSTSTWKTYTSETYGFAFMYPGELSVEEIGGFNSSSVIVDNKKGFPDILNVRICPFDCGEYPEERENFSKAVKVMIGGYSAKEVITEGEAVIYFTQTPKHSQFKPIVGQDFQSPARIIAYLGKDNRNLGLLNQILSTFRFVK